MTEKAPYQDIRADFWRACWSRANAYESYLEASEPKRADNWRRLGGKLPPLGKDRAQRLTGHGRILHVLVVSGVWCGDCVRQGPMLQQIAEAAGAPVELRVIDRDEIPELRDEVRILGAARVPVVIFLSEDFHEVGREGDRMLTTYRRKAEIELGAACAVPTAEIPPDELASERDEWSGVFERMLLMLRLAPPLRERHGD